MAGNILPNNPHVQKRIGEIELYGSYNIVRFFICLRVLLGYGDSTDAYISAECSEERKD